MYIAGELAYMPVFAPGNQSSYNTDLISSSARLYPQSVTPFGCLPMGSTLETTVTEYDGQGMPKLF